MSHEGYGVSHLNFRLSQQLFPGQLQNSVRENGSGLEEQQKQQQQKEQQQQPVKQKRQKHTFRNFGCNRHSSRIYRLKLEKHSIKALAGTHQCQINQHIKGPSYSRVHSSAAPALQHWPWLGGVYLAGGGVGGVGLYEDLWWMENHQHTTCSSTLAGFQFTEIL